ncbi:unnamed protein product [Acanthoscelides obtectus]|uniref:Uncharacterized protein n=1 Tax=Acanthoscelides obtectus TaxID=200917 RepID=A0A9P0KPC7_ACAOB|nr:unnamed protein product [Acanthoscelides obtectus]CAK1664971.1 hypothetical protein AOBTE_LOCUS24588 [Acanthoscelides obtectus]
MRSQDHTALFHCSSSDSPRGEADGQSFVFPACAEDATSQISTCLDTINHHDSGIDSNQRVVQRFRCPRWLPLYNLPLQGGPPVRSCILITPGCLGSIHLHRLCTVLQRICPKATIRIMPLVVSTTTTFQRLRLQQRHHWLR